MVVDSLLEPVLSRVTLAEVDLLLDIVSDREVVSEELCVVLLVELPVHLKLTLK
jgi:hypothetical protein